MNTLIEDTASVLGCTDRKVFFFMTHFNSKGKGIAYISQEAGRRYFKWKRTRIITQECEDYCLTILTDKYLCMKNNAQKSEGALKNSTKKPAKPTSK